MRLRSTAEASASRIVLPVYDMNTSSREGRDTLTERIATGRLANSRGTKCSPDSTEKVTSPSCIPASRPNPSASARMAAGSSAVLICTRSLPTEAFSASGVSMATIWPWSMIAILSQFSASSM